MIHNLKPYPAMKDSGVSWLGEVPGHWEGLPGRNCYSVKQILNKGLQERTVLSLSYGQIKVKPEEKLHGLVPASFETYQIVEPGDIICRPTDLQNDWNSLRFGLSRNRGIITSAYICFSTQAALRREYGHLLFHTYDLKKVFYGLGSGLRQNLDWKDFKYLPCLVPPLPEQDAIVRFLNYYDRKIRRYISAKQKLIKLLGEQKQAIIHHAVTRGLDPNFRLKPSGVEWLIDIPEHWEVLAVRRCATKIKTGGTPSGAGDEHFATPGFNWFTPGDFKNELYLAASDRQLSEVGEGNVKVFPPNTVMMIGIGATIGKVSISKGYASCNQQINAIVLNNRMDVEYFALSLRSLREYIVSCGKFTTMPIINQDGTKSLPLLVPPIREQQKIVEHIFSQVPAVDAAIFSALREMELLREYRTRLIADVVTGKLDVREVAARLPEEAEEPELPDEADVLSDAEEEPKIVEDSEE